MRKKVTKKKKAPRKREVKVKGNEIIVKGVGLIRMFKVGNEVCPASQTEIDDISEKLAKCYENPGTNLITHHAVDSCVIGLEEVQTLMQLYSMEIITAEELREKLGF